MSSSDMDSSDTSDGAPTKAAPKAPPEPPPVQKKQAESSSNKDSNGKKYPLTVPVKHVQSESSSEDSDDVEIVEPPKPAASKLFAPVPSAQKRKQQDCWKDDKQGEHSKHKRITPPEFCESSMAVASGMNYEYDPNLERSLLSELECPVCKEYMRPPIILCVNGHSNCNNCRLKICSCPICRNPFTGVRNLALERLSTRVKYPCTYKTYGCEGSFSYDSILDHQVTCQYSPQMCPVTKMKIDICSWNGLASDIQKHLETAHRYKCRLFGNPQRLQAIFLIVVSASHTSYRFLFHEGEIFCCRFQIKRGVFCAMVNSIGPAQSKPKYHYVLKFENLKRKETVTFCLMVRNFTDSDINILDSGNCVTVHPKLIDQFRTTNGKIIVHIELLRNI